MGEVWRIKAGRDGAGSFMCPPGHPALTHTIEGFFSRGDGKPSVTRLSGPDYIGGIGDAAGELGDEVPEHIRRQADRLHERAELKCSPDWLANVYGYFRNCYSPDGENRSASDCVVFKPGTCKGCGLSMDRGAHRPNRPLRRGETWHTFQPVERPPAERHLAYLMVRRYFPEHTPNLDLIVGKGTLYGTRPCIYCGQTCQYEARIDGWAPFGQSAVMCPNSPLPDGRHEINRG